MGSTTTSSRNFTNLDYFDLDRVEVVEGPQSALYGRDAEYGIVNLIHAKPTFTDSNYVDETFTGGVNNNQIAAVINHPLSDEVSVRLGGEAITQTGGFYYNPDTKDYYDSTSGWLGRGQIRLRHGPLDVDLEIAAQNLNLPAFAASYDLAPGKIATVPLGITQNQFVLPHSGLDDLNLRVESAMLLADYDLSWATLTSTSMVRVATGTQDFSSSYIDLATEAQLQAKNETGIYPFSESDNYSRAKTLYQDLHLTGTALGDRLNWLLGGEILAIDESNLNNTVTNPCTLKVGAGICGGTPTTPLCYLVLPKSTPCPSPFPLAFGQFGVFGEQVHSQAGYGSLSYQLGFRSDARRRVQILQ